MPETHAKHGPSGLKNKDHENGGCCHWQNDRFASTKAADEGTFLHEHMENWAGWILEKNKEPNDTLTEEQKSYVGFSQKVVEPFARQADHVGLEEKVTITNAMGEEVTWGTSDLVLATEKRLTLIDYKFGASFIESPQNNMQAKAYVAGAFQSYPEAETAEFIFVIPKRDEVLRHTFKKEDAPALVEEVAKIVDAANDPNSPYNPSQEACVFCGNKPKCPAINTAVATVAKEYGQLALPENFHSSAIANPSDMSRALDAAAILERWAKSVRHHAMEMVLNGDDVPGYELKYRQGKRTVRDVTSAWEVLQNTINLDDFLPACNVSITNLEKAVKERAPRGQKKALVEEVFDKLQDAGIMYRGDEVSYLGKQTK